MDTPGDARDIAVSGNYGYIADYGNGVIRFYVSSMGEREAAETQHLAYGVVKRADYVYVADGNAGIFILNVNLSERGSFDTNGTAYDLAVLGRYVYVADGQSGLRVINSADRGRPYEVGYYDTSGEAKGVAIEGNLAYVADGDNLGIYDC